MFSLWTWTATMMPLALLVIVINLSPFWTSLIAYWVHREPISKLEYMAMFICFFGVVGLTLGK